MTYSAAEARQELLDTVADAVEELAGALSSFGAAYEKLDEHAADRLEAELFGPLQTAYGRLQRVHAGFATRAGHATRAFAPAQEPPAGASARELLERAGEAVEEADAMLIELQDSGSPVEVGDRELRAGLGDVRGILADLPARTRSLERVLGR